METQNIGKSPILESAWKKFAEFDAVSVDHTAAYSRLRLWIALMGVLATLLAIVSGNYGNLFPPAIAFVLHLLLIVTPILASVIAAYTNKFFATGDWLVLRAGAEEVLKNVYIYRTIMQNKGERIEWLEEQLRDVQRAVFRGMNGEYVFKTFKGNLPPAPRFGYEGSDPGFNDLTGDEYFKYRLENELNWHIKKVNLKQKERVRLQVIILFSGAMGAILAALGFNIWVALTASLTTTLLGWQELKNLDLIVRNYSKVVLELNIIADHWNHLAPEQKTQSEFFKMVNFTEDLLWSRNIEYIKAMQEALKESGLSKGASLINNIINDQVTADKQFKQNMEDSIVGMNKSVLDDSVDTLTENFDEALNSLAEEASSDLVQAELKAMKDAVHDLVKNIIKKVGLADAIKTVGEDYDGIDISSKTPKGVLNDMISRYPKTGDLKG